MSHYVYYWKETDQEIVMMVNELRIIICEEFQTCSMNQSCMRSETEVSGSSFEVQKALLFCSRQWVRICPRKRYEIFFLLFYLL